MFTLKDILASTKGRSVSKGMPPSFSGISTDSRKIRRGELFIPIKGDNFDGHKFIGSALKKGAAAALTSKRSNAAGSALIRVKDTLSAFHDIALSHRKKFLPAGRHGKLSVTGITGSSGKTTTKDMLASILSLAGCTLKTEENYNNEIGVPQTLLKLVKKHKFAVIEMAMQGLGEIKELARISLPNIAIITNIGSAHMEHLGSMQNIARAKSEILAFQGKNDIAILPADDEYFGYLRKRSRGKVLSYGSNIDADVRATNIMFSGDSSIFTIETPGVSVAINLPLPGRHNVHDALAAAAAAFTLGIKPQLIKKGLETFRLSGKRTSIIRTKHFRVIDDTYNANPDSMAASLEMLENYDSRRIAVLGDMLELGSISKKSHRIIGSLAANLEIDALITVGRSAKDIALSAKEHGLAAVRHVLTNRQAVKLLNKMLRINDTVLIKGSRGMHMEEIVKGLMK